ncbi:hypothetical protein GS415_10375 [Rhodococcus hoagii]|nr:hypothetical protein [Prescottella equi]
MLGLVILLIIIGGLVPRWVHSQMMKLKDDTIENCESRTACRPGRLTSSSRRASWQSGVAEDRRDPDDPEPGSPTEGASR